MSDKARKRLSAPRLEWRHLSTAPHGAFLPFAATHGNYQATVYEADPNTMEDPTSIFRWSVFYRPPTNGPNRSSWARTEAAAKKACAKWIARLQDKIP